MKLIPERDIERARLKVALEDLHEAVRSVEAALARGGLDAPEGWLDAWRGYACPAPPPAPTAAWRAGVAAQKSVGADAMAIAQRRAYCAPVALDDWARAEIQRLAGPGAGVPVHLILHALSWQDVGALVDLLVGLDPRPELPPAVLALERILATEEDASTTSMELGELVHKTVAAARALLGGK